MKESSPNNVRERTRLLCATALGVAAYVALSMSFKLPIVRNIGLDLGYIALAICCYLYGSGCGAVVGGMGCAVVSLLTSGWFPPGWVLGNAFIGALCGSSYNRDGSKRAFAENASVSYGACLIGIGVIKTVVECLLFHLPLGAKIVSNGLAGAIDGFAMEVGVLIAPAIHRALKGTIR